MRLGANFKQALKAYASAIGLHGLGVAAAEPFDDEAALLRERLAEDRYPAFVSRDIEARCQPDAILPGARTIITVALSYLTEDARPSSRQATAAAPSFQPSGGEPSPGQPSAGEAAFPSPAPPDGPHGRISQYAWGADYHRVLREKLALLTAFIRQHAGGDARCVEVVDTAPPIDRAAAVRSGLGWYGKNCCVYVPRYGSWVFLGELYTDVEIEPDVPSGEDSPAVPSCGECTLCLDACPTGALEGPYQLDPQRCVSHLTQMAGDVPEALRARMGRWVFGCDICQLVCPWNREAQPGNVSEFRPDPRIGTRPSLLAMLAMSKEEFEAVWQPTAAGWRGRNILRRNAAIACGNARDPRAIPALQQAVDDPSPAVSRAAAWALAQIQGRASSRSRESESLVPENNERTGRR